MAGSLPPESTEREVRRSLLKLWLGAAAVAALLLFVLVQCMGPPPPKRFRLGAGRPDGVYQRHAQAYAEYLAREGIHVEVVETAGSVENLRRLEEGTLDVALAQGGTATPAQRAELQSLASVFLEPLWIFARTDSGITDLADLAGRRIAVGEEGSGTRDLAVEVLEATGVLRAGRGTTLLPVAGETAANALLAGELDAVFAVLAPGPAWLDRLVAAPEVDVVGIPRREAIARRFTFLRAVTIPEGLLDLDDDVPRRDLALIAPTAALVSRDTFHPALAALLLEAARSRHAEESFLAEAGTFPSPHFVEIPLSDDARRALERGPTWLYRVFPFWFASFLDRAILLLLPLLTLLFPFFKTAPPLYRWGVRRRIYVWYRNVREIDQAIRTTASRAELEAQAERLRRIGHEVGQVKIPLSYMREFYDLRLHLEFVQRRLDAALEVHPPGETSSADAAHLEHG